MTQANYALQPHPATAIPAGTHVAARITKHSSGLRIDYALHGEIADLLIPPPATPGPADNLWQHTCFEGFVADDASEAYHEFNFSPSGQWAIYRFDSYRQRNTSMTPVGQPGIQIETGPALLRLIADVPWVLLPDGPAFRIGLTAVVEQGDGSKSYWALAHAAPQPDFHLRQSFTLALNRSKP